MIKLGMKRRSRWKRGIAMAVSAVCISTGCLSLPGNTVTVQASSDGLSSNDTLNVIWSSGGASGAVPHPQGFAEGIYTATDAGNTRKGVLRLDNGNVGGHMHANIGETIDLYAPNADVDYTDTIGFSGNYTFQAAGGRGGYINAYDSKAGTAGALGGPGSVITNSRIDYSTGQSVTYRKGSNGRTVSKSQATNIAYWNHNTPASTISGFMGNINGLLAGQAQNYRAWTACAQVGTASYIQAGGSDYIVAGGGAPGVVLFEHDNGAYNARGVNGMHADQTPPLPSGADGFYNPGSSAMSKRYRDYNGTNNINAGRIAGVTAKVGIPVSSGWGGGVKYEDMFYGWVSNARQENMGLSKVYPGYSGLARRNGSLFSTDGMNDSQYGVAINTSASEPNPYVRLTCNAKYVIVYNPTRPGYEFLGWDCSGGVSPLGAVSDGNGSGYKFKVTASGAAITAKWKALNYTITYHGNGADGGSMEKQVCQMEKEYTLNANGFTRTGYTFAGWATSPDGAAAYADKAVIRNLTTVGGGNVNLYAKWQANKCTIHFDPNGGAENTPIPDMTVHYDEEISLPDATGKYLKYTLDGVNVTQDVLNGTIVLNDAGTDGTDTEEADAVEIEAEEAMPELEVSAPKADKKAYESVFMGWSLEDGRDSFMPQWKAGETLKAADIMDAAGVTDADGAVVTLYAVWDDCPWIKASDLYYTLEQAQSGFITEEEILSHAAASDREDGSPIPLGTHENGTSFSIPDYAPTDFTQFRHDGSCTENLTVVDSVGSVYAKQITVHIVDTTPTPVEPEGTTRFINEYYYNQPYENGGLEDNSIWKTNPEYVKVLKTTFDNIRNDTPIATYYFTREEILQMQEYVDEHGIGNTKEPDALQNFYDRFMAPNLQLNEIERSFRKQEM